MTTENGDQNQKPEKKEKKESGPGEWEETDTSKLRRAGAFTKSIDESDLRERLETSHDLLLTTSSILAGFALTGLLTMGFAEAGTESSVKIAAALGLKVNDWAFPIAFLCTLLATLTFLGVLVGIISSKLGRTPTVRSLRKELGFSVAIFGIGLAALFAATIMVGVPTLGGIFVGCAGGILISLGIIYRGILRK